MKRALSLLIEFLIYSSFAILAISYVLYYVYFVLEKEKSKMDIENLINTLNEFHSILSIYKECGICSFTFKKEIPEGSKIILVNNSDYINATYFSKTRYIPNYSGVDFIVYQDSGLFHYNISKKTYRYLINETPILNLYKNVCIKVNIFFNQILINSC